jgi:hypothetical protein
MKRYATLAKLTAFAFTLISYLSRIKYITMKTKIGYLNFILTICAIALTVIVLQNADIIPRAHAAGALGPFPMNDKGEMRVKVMNENLDVRVINKPDVNVDEVGGNATYGTALILWPPLHV